MNVTVHELPDVVALDLAADGSVVAPIAFVDLTDPPPPADDIALACNAAAPTSRVLVGVSHGAPALQWQPLMQALTCTLVEAPQDGALPETCAPVADAAAEAASLAARVGASPTASVVLNRLLRIAPQLPVGDGLIAESLAYSMLLAGSEFASWLAQGERAERKPEAGSPLLIERTEDTLTITLNRPSSHNAYSARMRDALVEALDLALCDSSITHVRLAGAGPSFCSGGDLDEFGTTPDPVTAHLIRTERSVARQLHQLRDRLEVRVHGACIGAGTEFAAFAGRVIADDDAYFQLPELAMGLVPGAGGTVSLSRRIGRWRTAYLALTGTRIDVATALSWGLVDRRSGG